MSLAQWAQVVSSFGIGGGTPVTITSRDGALVEQPPFQARMDLSTREIREAAERQMAGVREALDRLDEAVTGKAGKRAVHDALRGLRIVIDNVPANMQFVNDQMQRHVESVTTKARADIEATALRAGIAAGTLDAANILLGLGSGES